MINGVPVRIAGIAKGAGMIHPQLQAATSHALHATMLVYVFTDAVLAPAVAADLLHHAVEASFNRISIDGDTSTNDTVLLLASGASGVAIQGHNHEKLRAAANPDTEAFFFGPRLGLLIAGKENRGRRRRHPACSRVADFRRPHRCRCLARG